jgi:predicted DNA-binding transcriptional regulator YafY
MEGVLAWEGEIGNARVRKLFDLQPVQASRLLGEFRALMGDRIVEDGRAKVLKPAAANGFETDISLEQYVRSTQTEGNVESCIVDARTDLTDVRPAVFAVLRKAALKGTGVEITYASMTNPTFEARVIFPHSIIHVGRRWHVRGWCIRRQEFRDFTLGRIRSATPSQKLSEKSIDDDQEWNQFVQIRLAAHRGLSPDQQQVVRSEYFGGTMGRRLSVRACLAQYVILDLRAALNPEKEIPPEFQIEITNAAELNKVLFTPGYSR